MAEVKVTKDLENKTLVIECVMNGPKEKVWRAYAEKDLFEKWWGPEGWETTTKEFDFRAGGRLHYCMKCVDKNQGESGKPRYLRLPSLDVNARIKEMGINQSGNIDAPWNIYDAGWYNGTIVPGSKSGVSLLVGHVSGMTMPGVFNKLDQLAAGDIVEVELGDGTQLRYSVDKVEEYGLEDIDLRKILYDVPEGKQSLRLMTCSGSYNVQYRQFDSRTVVYASPVE